MKLPSHAWLFFLLPLSGIAFAAPEPLLKVVVASPTMSANGNSNSCTLDGNGKVIIEHTVKLSPTGPSLKSKEVKNVHLSVNDIKSVIAEAAQGNITGKPSDIFTYQYFAYQQQEGQTKKIFLLDRARDEYGLANDSPAVVPLTKFIDSVCGDLSFVAYQDIARRAEFSTVILEVSGIKAALDVCSQTYNGFGTPGTAGACDGTPSGDLGVFAALNDVVKRIAEMTTKIASITMTQSDANHIAITATAFKYNGLNGESYILNGTYSKSGFIIWNVDPSSTCKTAGIC